MDRPNECFRVSEGLMLEMMRFEVMPDTFDIVQFGRIEQNDVADLGLLLAQLQARPTRSTSVALWRPFSVWRGPPPAELFLCNALDSCERLMRTPSRSAISARSREIVQLRRSATGASSNGAATRNAASLFTGAGPGATRGLQRLRAVAHEVAAPQADCVFTHAKCLGDVRARPAGQRQQHGTRPIRLAASREPASAVSAARWSLVAESGDRPVIVGTCESVPLGNKPVGQPGRFCLSGSKSGATDPGQTVVAA